jgi:signal transduction histidine kinase
MKASQLKIMIGWLMVTSLISIVLVAVLLANVLSLDKQLKSLSASNNNQATSSNDGPQLSNLQTSVDNLSNTVNMIKINTSTTVKPSSMLTCSGSTFSYGSSTGSINLTCNSL